MKNRNENCLKIQEAIRTLGVDFVKAKQWNEDTVKVEVSSPAFEGVRRLDRFERLNAVLKEKLPEIFSSSTFIFKAFTMAEWEEKNKAAVEAPAKSVRSPSAMIITPHRSKKPASSF